MINTPTREIHKIKAIRVIFPTQNDVSMKGRSRTHIITKRDGYQRNLLFDTRQWYGIYRTIMRQMRQYPSAFIIPFSFDSSKNPRDANRMHVSNPSLGVPDGAEQVHNIYKLISS
jgi:hypothetical protein